VAALAGLRAAGRWLHNAGTRHVLEGCRRRGASLHEHARRGFSGGPLRNAGEEIPLRDSLALSLCGARRRKLKEAEVLAAMADHLRDNRHRPR